LGRWAAERSFPKASAAEAAQPVDFSAHFLSASGFPERLDFGKTAEERLRTEIWTTALLEKCGTLFALRLSALGRGFHFKCSCGFQVVFRDERARADSPQRFPA